MREIKFRIWCKQQREMFEVKNLRFDNNELWYAEDYENEVPYYFDNKDCELMQYTGLKDENGNEIYENDILMCRDRLVKVIWNNTIGSYDVIFLKYIEKDTSMPNIDLLPVCFKYLEIVGNVYENPELT